MIRSIKKYSKSILFKILVGIIILPFLFWGMGDVFRGGSQNVVAKIDSEKVSTQEFINYIKMLNLNSDQIKNLKNSDLVDKILSSYIGGKVLKLELEKLNIQITDSSLKNLITNDKTFFKDEKFSRTEYEKFLITSSLNASTFEKNIAEQEKKRQLLGYLSEGIKVPDFLVQYEYNRENQTKYIDYIDLKNFYNKSIPLNEIKKSYDKNKSFFSEVFKNIEYAELKPEYLTGNNQYNENYFKKINEIENKVLDNFNFAQIKSEYNLDVKETGLVNKSKEKNGSKTKIEINDKIFKKFFEIEQEKSLRFLDTEGKFYLAQVIKKITNDKSFEDKDVQESIKAQILIKTKIENNAKFAKEISLKNFNRNKINNFAKKNNLEIKSIILNNLDENKIFNKGIIKRIFETDNNEINFITDNLLKNNFIIYTKKTDLAKIKRSDAKYNDYKLKAKLKMANEIYNNYDLSLNNSYNVEINNKTLSRIKNSF